MRSVHPAYIAARAKRLRGASQLCRFLSQSRRNTASMRAMFAQMQGAVHLNLRDKFRRQKDKI